MANYYGSTRTNYFHVKDEEKFRDMMEHVITYDGHIDIWEAQDREGNKTFAFGGYAIIAGYQENPKEADADPDADPDYEEFILNLSECLCEDDAAIIYEIGQEKLRYLSAYAIVVTSKGHETLNLLMMACDKASEMLKNPDWETRCDY